MPLIHFKFNRENASVVEKGANAVTALRDQYYCEPVTASQKGGHAVAAFACNVAESKIVYCYHTDVEYDLEEVSISDIRDNDDDNLPYGKRREVYKFLGKYR